MSISGVILAAGQGTRMKSPLPKVLQSVLGKPMINYAQEAIADFEKKYVIVGHQSDKVIQTLFESYIPIIQEKQLGTGHAIATLVESKEYEDDKNDYLVVIPGDVPLIKKKDLDLLINDVVSSKAAIGLITAEVNDPFGYGRIVKNKDEFEKIIEESDANEQEKQIKEINSGIYCIDKKFLKEYIGKIESENIQNEFYLTDLINIAFQNKLERVIVQVSEDSIQGVNSMSQLNDVENTLRKELIQTHMDNGVYFQDPNSTYLDKTVTIEPGAKILANCHLTGSTNIKKDCVIGPNSIINDSEIGEGSSIQFSVVDEAEIKSNGKIGPYAHLRKGSILDEDVKVGAFAETKNSTIGKGSKVPHLAYVGDAELEEDVNFSAGAITVNYDGKEKHKTEIKKNAFVGSDAMLVAPVTIGEGAMVGAGSVITKDVPPGALGIERNDQKNIDGYMERKNKKGKK